MKRILKQSGIGLVFAVAISMGGALAERACAAEQRIFESPEAALASLLDALQRQDDRTVLAILGPQYEDQIFGQDRQAAHDEQAAFIARANQALELRAEGEDRRIAYVGPTASPMAIPIVREAAGWRFDTEEGIDELANRRIGGNELATITTMRAYIDAQQDYASQDRDGDQVLEYAQRLRSQPGQQDGLYWATTAGEAPSPVGPLIAAAVESHDPGDSYNGYHYRILTRQGSAPPGGAYDYVINGNMIAGFALLAWPAEYGHSGIMSFLVSHQGKVYEKNLGPDTAQIAGAMQAYDPDSSWSEATD